MNPESLDEKNQIRANADADVAKSVESDEDESVELSDSDLRKVAGGESPNDDAV